MSFASDVKTELCTVRPGDTADAECFGMLCLCRSFGVDKIMLQTASRPAAERFASLLRRNFDIIADLRSGGETRPVFRVAVTGDGDRKKIFFHYGLKPDQPLLLDPAMFQVRGSAGAFIRGAFLSGGTVSDPNKEYRLEFSFKERETAEQFQQILLLKSLPSHLSPRGKGFVVYIKDSAILEDILTVMGASSETLNLIGVKIYKSFRNKSNRINNCETSNILKTANAAYEQNKAIKKLQKSGRLQTLPEELYEVAMLRLSNPELSLSAICRLSTEKLTRSGFQHRMKKIMEIADEER